VEEIGVYTGDLNSAVTSSSGIWTEPHGHQGIMKSDSRRLFLHDGFVFVIKRLFHFSDKNS